MAKLIETADHRLIRATIINPLGDSDSDFFSDGLLVGAKSGDAWKIDRFGPAEEVALSMGLKPAQIPKVNALLIPPFYDNHFHWVQDKVREMPKVSLLEWLETYTFPEEARFAEETYAEKMASQFWKRIVSLGTVGGLCYSSIHDCALDAALDHAPSRFKVGNTLMTMNCPDFLRQSESEAIASAQQAAVRHESRYAVSPRFAPTTHPKVMSAAARIAAEFDLFQQTHLSETHAEIKWVLSLYQEIEGFEDVQSYTEIYDRCEMLGPKTVMGHAIHLSEAEWERLAETDTAIASCPTSNAPLEERGLGSGLFDYQAAEKFGVRWSLASDIGGGPYLSMFDVIESFVRQNENAGNSASYSQALYRSTLAGAEILGLAKESGNFQSGKSFDCLVCPLPEICPKLLDTDQALKALLSTATHRADYANLVETAILEGEVVYDRSPTSAL